MKTYLYLTVFVLLLGFSSCKLAGDSNYTPMIGLFDSVKINGDSTISMKNGIDGNFVIDSLHVNDTAMVVVGADGYLNNLLKLSFKVDNPNNIEILEPHDTIKKYFDPASDYLNGSIVMKKDIIRVFYPFEFVAKEAISKVKIDFKIESEAKEVSNVSALTLEFPIKP